MEKSQNADVSNNSENNFSELFSLFSSLSEDSSSQETSLLSSLKPYLSQNRKKKIDQCEKIMTLVNTFKLINDLEDTEKAEE